MRVKRYVVETMPDALQKIRADLGKDAVILNTKEIRSGGFLGMFSKKRIEVIAATDASAVPNAKPAGGSPKTAPIIRPNSTSASTTTQGTAGVYNRPSAVNANPVFEEKAQLAFPEVPDVIVEKPVHLLHVAAAEKKPVIQQAPMEPTRDDVVLEELKQMKSYMQKLSVQSMQQVPLDPTLEQLKQRLTDQELDTQLVEEIMNKLLEEADGVAVSEEQAWASAKQQLLQYFPESYAKGIAADTKVVHFVGPTGVGKTTTIAKLAAEQVLKYHRKVGFITSDTYRIAAVEQLKTYATILNVPLEVVFSPQDLPKAFDQLKDRDIIFMDTAGRNFRNEMYVSELNALLQSSGNSETFLVLSLTTKYKDMKAIADNFQKFKLDKVLFTKMDETESFGPIVNLVHDFKLQLSYVTNGQSVPDDIFELSEQDIVELLLGD